MATSGSTNFSQTRDQIIYDAYQHLGVYGIGRTISPDDMALAVRTLNSMIKAWSTQGLHLWCKSEGVLYLGQYQAKYSLGNMASNAYATNVDDEIITQLSADLVANATAVTVENTSGMVVGDYIGIVLTNKDIYWTTIAAIPSSTTLTLAVGISAAAANNSIVYTFTNRLYKPLRVLSARSVAGIDSGSTSTKNEVLMNMVGYERYFDMPVKTTSGGRPINCHYNPRLTSGNMYIWPRPNDCSCRIEFTYERVLEDLDSASDDFDLPSEWTLPILFNLATLLGPAFGKDQKVITTIGPMASSMLEALKSWDNEIDAVSLVPDLGYD